MVYNTECNGKMYVDMVDYTCTQNTCCAIFHRYHVIYLQTSNSRDIMMNVKVHI